MTTMLSLSFRHNPVARAEFRHQQYVLETSRSGNFWIALALVLLVPAFIASMIFFISGLVNPFVPVNILPPEVNGQLAFAGFLLLIVMNVALYAVVTLITVGLAASSILREKQGKTWENLLLTNIDAHQIVFGKWWATIRALWGDQWMVALLRFGLIAWAVGRFVPAAESGFPMQAVHILVLSAIMMLFTLIDAAFSSALGVFSPLPSWSGVITATLLLALRLLSAAVSLFWFALMFLALINTLDFTYLLVGGGGLALFTLATWGVLRVAQIVAVWEQASPPARRSMTG